MVEQIVLEKIDDAKNICYVMQIADKKYFVKIYNNPVSASIEQKMLMLFSDLVENNKTIFSVPKSIASLTAKTNSAIICDYVLGRTLKSLLYLEKSYYYKYIAKIVQATAQIHYLGGYSIKETQDELTYKVKCFDGQQRLHQLLTNECSTLLMENEILFCYTNLIPYFEFLEQIITGFPCDLYKDANPANWIVNEDEVVAIDFESERILPFLVDFINVTEYAQDYLTNDEIIYFLNIYIEERVKLSPSFNNIIKSFDVLLLLSFFRLYRHQEQMVHRLRDIVKNKQVYWHTKAFWYHCQKIRIELSYIRKTKKFSLIVENIEEVLKIYQLALNRTMNLG